MILFKDLNSFRRALAVAGPMLGKPSRIYLNCSFFERDILLGLS